MSLSRFGPLTAHLTDVAMVLDEAGALIEAAPGVAGAFDWSEPLAPGHPVIDVVHPDDRDRLTGQFSTLTPGASGRADARVRTRPPCWTWYELTVTDLRHDPLVGGFLVAGRDISVRKRMEQQLLRSEAYVKSLVQHASDTTLVLDANVRIRYASPAAKSLFGRSPAQLLGTNVIELVHPDDRQSVADRFLETADRTGRTAYLDFRVEHAGGEDHRVEAAATNLLDHPAMNGIVVNLRDLARRDQAREQTERSERRFRKLIANISDTITLADASGRIMMVTGAAREILGYPGEHWPGRNIFDMVHPDDRERALAMHQAVLERSGGEVSGQFRTLHADGSWVDIEINVVNLLDDPDVRGAVITSRNISSHKAVERALSAAHREALDALAAKAEFVAHVGHEVRTPIHGIIGLTELLAESELDDGSRRLVESIRRAGEGLSLVIDDLLDFSKMEAGRLEIHPGVVSPHRLVADVVDMLRPQADEKAIALVGSLDERVPVFVRGDELRLRQVLVNLLGNAVKYTDQGSVSVSVETVKRMGQGCLLRFEVTDTGVGIPPDEIERLFEPFTQASTAAPLRRPGTGLGLTITRQLVELMGGDIDVTSEVGRGSTFAFTFPTVVSTPDEVAPMVTAAGGVRPGQVRGRVLVVEDSPVNRALVERQLLRLGCDPVLVDSGAEALGLMEELDLDLVLLDWQLPDITGPEVARQRREREDGGRPRLPLVGMSAMALPDARARCLDAGMDEYLAKPVRLDDLGALLGRFLPVDRDDPAGDLTPDRLVDPVVLATLVDEVGDPEIAARVVATYLGELDGRLAVLRDSCTGSDRDTLQRTAHTLKSTSRALGAEALAEASAELERSALDPGIDPVPLVHDIVQLAAGSAAALRLRLADLTEGLLERTAASPAETSLPATGHDEVGSSIR